MKVAGNVEHVAVERKKDHPDASYLDTKIPKDTTCENSDDNGPACNAADKAHSIETYPEDNQSK